MSEVQEFTLTLTQEEDFVFRIAFDDTTIPICSATSRHRRAAAAVPIPRACWSRR